MARSGGESVSGVRVPATEGIGLEGPGLVIYGVAILARDAERFGGGGNAAAGSCRNWVAWDRVPWLLCGLEFTCFIK